MWNAIVKILAPCPPCRLTSAGGNICNSLIADEPWDCYHLESLLALKETYRENTEFGFLLRCYWIPATVLTFRQSSRTMFPDRRVEQCDLEIERKMARCRSNECLWREKIRSIAGGNGNGKPSILSEMLCSYDCYEQTYASAKPILFTPRLPIKRRRPAVKPSIVCRCFARRVRCRSAFPGTAR